jgi:hypothetical protein
MHGGTILDRISGTLFTYCVMLVGVVLVGDVLVGAEICGITTGPGRADIFVLRTAAASG